MAQLSGSQAIGVGFRLIGRRPFAVLVWGVLYSVITFAPQVYGYWAIWPEVTKALRSMGGATAAGGNGGALAQAMEQIRLEMLPYQLMQIPLGFVALAVVFAAIYRAVLEPRDSGFAYLRLGVQELWMLAVSFAGGVIGLIVFVPTLIVAAIAGMGARQLPQPAAGLAIFLIVVGLIALCLWLGARMSLALPMTFAQRRFRFFESWGLTRGHGWQIVGVMLALVLIIILIEVVLGIILFAAVLAGVGTHWQGMSAAMARSPDTWIAGLAPWIAVGSLAYAALIGAFHALVVAPAADIYRQLTAEAPSPADFGAP